MLPICFEHRHDLFPLWQFAINCSEVFLQKSTPPLTVSPKWNVLIGDFGPILSGNHFLHYRWMRPSKSQTSACLIVESIGRLDLGHFLRGAITQRIPVETNKLRVFSSHDFWLANPAVVINLGACVLLVQLPAVDSKSTRISNRSDANAVSHNADLPSVGQRID